MTARTEALQRQLAALADQIAVLNDRPEEPVFEDDNAVISFQKRYNGRSHYTGRDAVWTYSYAATRINSIGKWLMTGKTGASYFTWDELLDFIEKNEAERPAIFLATSWEQL